MNPNNLQNANDSGFNGMSNGLTPNHSQFQDDEISLKELFDKLMSGKWLVLIGYALVLGGVAFYTYT